MSTLDLAGRLERRSVQDRHRLLVLLIQEPHAWAARAALGGFWGTYLAGRPSASPGWFSSPPVHTETIPKLTSYRVGSLRRKVRRSCTSRQAPASFSVPYGLK